MNRIVGWLACLFGHHDWYRARGWDPEYGYEGHSEWEECRRCHLRDDGTYGLIL